MNDEWRCKDCGQTFEEGPCPVWEARLGDDVNEPRHYNKQGIEVIDVIEAYELPYKLGNVIKYVLRHQYKDDPIKDLKKARWYLDRTIKEGVELREEEIELAEEAQWDKELEEWQEKPTIEEAIAEKDELYQSFHDPTGLKARGYTQEDIDEIYPFPVGALVDQVAEKGYVHGVVNGYSAGWVEVRWFGLADTKLHAPYALKLREDVDYREGDNPICDEMGGKIERPETGQPILEVDLGPARIAGETPAATDVKDEFYKFDRHAIRGWCAWCDREIGATQPFVRVYADLDNSFMCCSQKCSEVLRAGGFK